MLSRQHYQNIAAAIKGSRDTCGDTGMAGDALSVVDDLAHAIANYFQSDNPRFDRDRFFTACGLNGE
jgi:hypothetical protein